MASGALVMGALKVVGGVMAAKTAVEGIKEGNLLKAALGGVGAYMSFSGLASAGTGDVVSAGVDASKGTIEDIAAQEAVNGLETVAGGVSDAASPAVMNAAQAGTSVADGVVSNGLMDKIGGFANDLGLESAGDWLAKSNDAGGMFGSGGALDFGSGGSGGLMGEGGLLGSDYAKGQLVSGGLQLYGGKMAGDGMQERAEWELAEKKKQYEAERGRRASIGDVSFMNNLQWNPQAGKFQQTA